MRFEIELAQQSDDIDDIRTSFGNIKADIAAIDNLVGATLSYAILERADMSLNLGEHDFSTLVPAIADFVRRDTRSDLRLRVTVPAEAGRVVCDMHLMETVLKNLLYNAARYARHEIHVSFSQRGGRNELSVDDDGPGVPEADRQRVFDSFVQLEPNGGRKAGFGLGLAIVKRTLEWHHGGVTVTQSVLGGARFCASWPSA
jgi:signal transduction histidine kinase